MLFRVSITASPESEPIWKDLVPNLVFFTHQVGSFLGAWAGGRIYDYYGSYEPIWWSTVVLAFCAALIHLPINDKPVERLRLQTA